MNKLFDLSDFQKRFIYRVEKDDDLNSIADRFHTTPISIISLNSLAENICEGELLMIEKIDGNEYIVKPGDDFDKLSGFDSEKRREIITKNKTDVLFVGQKIYI